MAKIHFDEKTILALPQAAKGQVLYFDEALSGFGLRVGAKTKTYIVDARVKGKTRQISLGRSDALTLKKARALAKKELGNLASGIDRNLEKATERAKSLSVQEALDLYLTHKDLRERTKRENRRLIENNFQDWLTKDLKSFTPTTIVRRFDRLSERSASTANHAFWVLRAVMNYARITTKSDAGEFTLPPNPCDRLTELERWHKPNARKKKLDKGDYPALLEALASSEGDFPDFVEILLRTGLRRNEAATLEWSDIDLEKRTLKVRAEIAKNKQELILPLAHQVHKLFQRRLDAAPEAVRVFGGSKYYDPRKSLIKLRKMLGQDLWLHDLRRTYASLGEELSVPYSLLKKLLNHTAGGDVTLAHYANSTTQDVLRPFAQRINDQIDRLAHVDNPDLKALDALERLKKAVQELEEFERYRDGVDEIKRLVADLS